MSETVRCPMCPNHCEVSRIRCIRGRQWQMRQRNKMKNSQKLTAEPIAQQEKDQQNQK